MKKLWLLRHGQTLFNKKDYVQGQCDSPLTDLGKQQARAAGEFLKSKGVHPDHVYTSDLPRTQETLMQFYDGPFVPLKALRERSYGIFEGDANATMRYTYHDPELKAKCLIEDDESLIPRIKGAMDEIMENPDNQEVLVVLHGDCMKTFASAMDPEPFQELGRMRNCIIFELDYDEETGKYKVQGIHQDFLDQAGL